MQLPALQAGAGKRKIPPPQAGVEVWSEGEAWKVPGMAEAGVAQDWWCSLPRPLGIPPRSNRIQSHLRTKQSFPVSFTTWSTRNTETRAPLLPRSQCCRYFNLFLVPSIRSGASLIYVFPTLALVWHLLCLLSLSSSVLLHQLGSERWKVNFDVLLHIYIYVPEELGNRTLSNQSSPYKRKLPLELSGNSVELLINIDFIWHLKKEPRS